MRGLFGSVFFRSVMMGRSHPAKTIEFEGMAPPSGNAEFRTNVGGLAVASNAVGHGQQQYNHDQLEHPGRKSEADYQANHPENDTNDSDTFIIDTSGDAEEGDRPSQDQQR